MKYLIFGATGFIGSKLAQSLVDDGHEVINVSRSKENQLFKTLSYDEEETIVDFLSKADGVIFSSGKRLTKDFDFSDYLENLNLLNKVIKLLELSNQKNCIFLSSIGVYGDEYSPWKEADNLIPSNLYALSKKHQDDIIEFYNRKGRNFKILRLAQVMGLGERKGFLFNTFFDNAINGKDITVMGTGKGKRQYIYIKDIVSAVKKILTLKDVKGIYNLGISESTSIEDLAYIMKGTLNSDININYIEYDKEDLKDRVMNVDKIKADINFVPQFSVITAIKDMKDELERNN